MEMYKKFLSKKLKLHEVSKFQESDTLRNFYLQTFALNVASINALW